MSERHPSIVVSDALLADPFDEVTKGFFAAGDELSREPESPDLAPCAAEPDGRRGRTPWHLAAAAAAAGVAFGALLLALLREPRPTQSFALPRAVAAVTTPAAPPPVAATSATSSVPSTAPAVATSLPSPQQATTGAAAVPEDAAARAVQACQQAASHRAKPKLVVAACREAFLLAPTSADVAVALARSEFERGRAKEALDWANQAIAIDPDLADAYVFLGGAEQARGRASAARSAYRRYLQLSPKGRYAAELSAILQSL